MVAKVMETTWWRKPDDAAQIWRSGERGGGFVR
jgi:hypothetical protein